LHETYTDDQIEDSIDKVIAMMDKNKDGFIEYSEFVNSGGQ
jgi:Ca2+-binding EF-hand superfamily protein